MYKIMIGAMTLAVGGMMLTGCGNTPSDEVVKNIAWQYGQGSFREEEINIASSYEKEGKVVMVMSINNAICEMPTIKVKENWQASSFNCNGSPRSTR